MTRNYYQFVKRGNQIARGCWLKRILMTVPRPSPSLNKTVAVPFCDNILVMEIIVILTQ